MSERHHSTPPGAGRAIRTVTLDWGDTLAANYGMPYLSTQRRAFARLADDLRRLGCAVPDDFAARAMADLAVDWKRSIDMQANPEHREFDFRAMLNSWIAAAGGIDADPHGVRLALERCTTTLTDTVIPYGDSAAALSLLKARGYRIGILSHTPWPGDACRSWFVRHGLAPYIDFYSLSCEIGWIKPNPRHYQHALDQAGCAAAEILHVGDHPERDIAGARRFGFRTCLRVTENMYPSDALAGCRPDAEILHLRELVAVLDGFSR
jgi:putative hydrolase of the HAD superfamily